MTDFLGNFAAQSFDNHFLLPCDQLFAPDLLDDQHALSSRLWPVFSHDRSATSPLGLFKAQWGDTPCGGAKVSTDPRCWGQAPRNAPRRSLFSTAIISTTRVILSFLNLDNIPLRLSSLICRKCLPSRLVRTSKKPAFGLRFPQVEPPLFGWSAALPSALEMRQR